MYYRTTSLGITVSTIEMFIRNDSGIDIAEFMFNVKTPQGDEYVFRYQLDEVGIPAWHLYPLKSGHKYLATEKRHRDSLGFIPVNYMDSDIEQLLNKIKAFPEVVIYILVPGHKDSERETDIVLFPLDMDTTGDFMAITSISKYIIGKNRIAQKIGKILKGAVLINFRDENKKRFDSADKTELGQIKQHFISDGFHIYISDASKPFGSIPPSIRKEIEKAVFTPFYLERKSDDQNGCIIATPDGKPVGEIRNINAIIEKYGEMAQQKLRIDSILKQNYETSKQNMKIKH